MHTHPLTVDVAPWVLFRALSHRKRPFYIDAAQPWGEKWISSMGFGPRMQFRVGSGGGALAALDEIAETIRPSPQTARRPRPLPFGGGAVVALAYEAKNEVERLPAPRGEREDAAHLVGAVYDAVIAYDHQRHEYVVASHELDAAALARYADEVRSLAADAKQHIDASPFPQESASLAITKATYTARVERALEYIAAGDVYQVNLSMPVDVPLCAPPIEVYDRLRAIQPVPFGAFVDCGPEQLLSNSPELFLRRRGDEITTCPIKGTRPRGHSAVADRAYARELTRDAKERAEHVMIVDLERNDLGRLCRTGSVEVARMGEVTRLATLHHMVSTVRGRLRADTGTGALLRATFPSGSITGAPKIRAMEIIDELEDGARGFYTGAIGWVDASGDLDLNVAIRTAVARAGRLTYRIGSGIVADSSAEHEYDECLLKAEAFLRATGRAVPNDAAAARATGG